MRDRDPAAIEQRLGEISRERDVLNAEAAELVEQRRYLEAVGENPDLTNATVIAPEPIKSAEALGDI